MKTKSTQTITIALLMGTFVALCLWQPTHAQGALPHWQTNECPVTPPSNLQVECGTLTVPEDHNQPEGRTIQIAVAILKSRAANPAPDPLVFLNGGPGAHTMQFLNRMAAQFEPFTANRDVIWFDQRGVGLSQPAIDCPELDAQTTTWAEFDSVFPSILDAISVCKIRLENQGVNLAAYNTTQSVEDLEDLRLALGYDQWNLFGASYGTRYALTVMRDQPQGLRSVILASVYPPQMNLYDAAPNTDRAFNVLFDGCATSPLCNFFYPNLKAVFYETVEQLSNEPVILEVENNAGELRKHTLNGVVLMDAVFNLLYSAQGIELLPALIYDLHDGIYTLPRQLLARSDEANEPVFSAGLAFSVQCSEEVPFMSRSEVLASAEAYPEAIQAYVHQRLLFTDRSPEICQAWLVAHPDPIENQPVRSDIPTLVLAGQYDPVTPPAWSKDAASYLSHNYFYEFPNLGHSIGGVCPTAIMLSFLGNPNTTPDSSCMSRMETQPNFAVRPEAARWPAIMVSVVLIAAVTGYGGVAGREAWRRRAFSWGMSARLAGWVPLAVSGVVTALLLITARSDNNLMKPLQQAHVVETIIPLVAAIHAALLFSPGDEPALEIAMAAPRPLAWTLLERWGLIMLGHGAVGMTLTFISTQVTGEELGLALIRWFAPMCFLVGVALCITLTTRQPVFSAGLILLVWFGLAWAGDGMLANYPYLWPLHAFLQPDYYLFWLNRIFLIAAGLSAVIAAARIVNDSERMLLGRSAVRKHSGSKVMEAQ